MYIPLWWIIVLHLMAPPKVIRIQHETPKTPTWDETCHTVWDMETEPICLVRKA